MQVGSGGEARKGKKERNGNVTIAGMISFFFFFSKSAEIRKKFQPRPLSEIKIPPTNKTQKDNRQQNGSVDRAVVWI